MTSATGPKNRPKITIEFRNEQGYFTGDIISIDTMDIDKMLRAAEALEQLEQAIAIAKRLAALKS